MEHITSNPHTWNLITLWNPHPFRITLDLHTWNLIYPLESFHISHSLLILEHIISNSSHLEFLDHIPRLFLLELITSDRSHLDIRILWNLFTFLTLFDILNITSLWDTCIICFYITSICDLKSLNSRIYSSSLYAFEYITDLYYSPPFITCYRYYWNLNLPNSFSHLLLITISED